MVLACSRICLLCKVSLPLCPTGIVAEVEDPVVLTGASCVFAGFSEQYAWEEARAPPEQHLRTTYQQRTKL